MLYFKINTGWTMDELKTEEAGKRLEKSNRKRETKKVFVQANVYQCFKDFVLSLSLFVSRFIALQSWFKLSNSF